MDALADGLRWANAFGFVLVAVGYALRLRRTWGRRGTSERRFTAALMVLFVVIAFGSVEAYVSQTPFAWRVPAMTVALGGLLHGLLSHPQDPPATSQK